MVHKPRPDKRKPTQLRPMKAKVGVIPRADGSAQFQIGETTAIVAVYGPRDLHPRFMQDPSTGILRCHYVMMPFSGHGSRIRPGGNRRSKEISMVIRNALLPVLNLKSYPNSVVDVFIQFPQTDAGTRCAGICAAAMALADAGLQMKDLVSAVSIGHLNGQLLTDINGHEDCDLGAVDIPVAIIPSTGQVTLLQMDGILQPKELTEAIELAQTACKEIYKVQQQALKDKYTGEHQ